ncbi:hypothetical protein ABZW03_27285 [Kitasatospora sp. NPDC004799]|uniref:hypothetical protein n=1 Tax=Kitasatospora sp. NPDC004799 TaxID=3154460 RepID=UPI0033A25BB4
MGESATPPTVYQVHGHTAPGGDARVRAATQTIPVDGFWGSAPSGAPGPADLLAAAFAACLLKNVERSSWLLPFRYQRAEVDVQLRRQDAPPRFTAVTVVPVAPPAG